MRERRSRRLRPGCELQGKQNDTSIQSGSLLLHGVPQDTENIGRLLRKYAFGQKNSVQSNLDRGRRSVSVFRFLRVLRTVPHHVARYSLQFGSQSIGHIPSDLPPDGAGSVLEFGGLHHHYDDLGESWRTHVLVAYHFECCVSGESRHGRRYIGGVLLAFSTQFFGVCEAQSS